MTETLFWIFLSIIAYTYVGYTLLLILLNVLKRIIFFGRRNTFEKKTEYPEVTLLIAAYNEKEIIESKIQNSRALNYPEGKLKMLWITDGSSDGTPDQLKKHKDIILLHQDERRGKTNALNRAMGHVTTPFVVFCDANSMLNPDAIRLLMDKFDNPKVGCVAGEKRIAKSLVEAATGTGEGIYWEYESLIKKQESDFYSTLGAAGELYAIRSDLFEPVADNLIIDDFINSMQIAKKGYRIRYAPEAFAQEEPSFNIREELKRKIRIASGGFQALAKYPSFLNIFRFGFLSLEFFSHKVLRWAVVPFSILFVFILNLYLCLQFHWQNTLFLTLFILQILFYLLAIIGGFIEKRSIRFKWFYLPFYLVVMNYAQIAGLWRFITRKHSVVWEKVKRSDKDK